MTTTTIRTTMNAIAGPSKLRCVSRARRQRQAQMFGVCYSGSRRTMSVRPEAPKEVKEGDVAPRKKMTIQKLHQMKQTGVPITMLTAYDYPTGRACEAYGVDITLVGDSLAQVCLGYPSTTRLTLTEMLHHVQATSRGSSHPLLIADMPFGTYASGVTSTIQNAIKLIQEGGADGVKMEGGGEDVVENVEYLTRRGIPVMGHVGLLPQRHTSSSGYRVQGRDATSADEVLRAAKAVEKAGAFAVVLEAIPSLLGEYITKELRIPTIGIGAGSGTDGQVLVWDDLVGNWSGHKAKFVRRFADAKSECRRGVLGYIQAVRKRSFPDESESYGIDQSQWQEFLEIQKGKGKV